ncbi:protein AF1q [Microcaecilia unicolor]|uniref:Protein AF1q n=1 Tax=Microcaecilia unicolor TaxID=1415580 RepID=A0A6P7WSW5_9AMPH|nr:protein AF1q [Microcaecilia unicolor]
MLDTLSSQYDSFLFWKLPIPDLDPTELEGLGLSGSSALKERDGFKLSGGQREAGLASPREEDSLLQYSTFNFWRAPIVSLDSFQFDLM